MLKHCSPIQAHSFSDTLLILPTSTRAFSGLICRLSSWRSSATSRWTCTWAATSRSGASWSLRGSRSHSSFSSPTSTGTPTDAPATRRSPKPAQTALMPRARNTRSLAAATVRGFVIYISFTEPILCIGGRTLSLCMGGEIDRSHIQPTSLRNGNLWLCL